MADTKLAALESFLQDHPNIECILPSAPEYPASRQVWNYDRTDRPLAIARPKSAADVSALVRHAKSTATKITVRAGGHNLAGLAIAEGALLIDMQALSAVTVAEDHQSATVQGGILQLELAARLAEKGLATPSGSVPSVGYVGWATYGGYGPFSGHWGLGVDQILAATVVTADGEVVKVDENHHSDLWKGIRGGGGLFGVIIDLTIKVYPLKNILAGAIIYNSPDFASSFPDFNAAFQNLLATEGGPPPELTLQQMLMNTPGGPVHGVLFMWSSDDHSTGEQWSQRVAALGPVAMNTIAPTTIPAALTSNGALVLNGAYGNSYTHSVRQVTPEVARIVARHLGRMPPDAGAMLSFHQLRGYSAESAECRVNSVFATREPHFMLELLGFASVPEARADCVQWASDLHRDLLESGISDLLPNTYISLDLPKTELTRLDDLVRYFGSHAQEVLELKRKYDPENVFDLTVPRLKNLM